VLTADDLILIAGYSMRRTVLSSFVAIAGLMCLAGSARAETRDDLCVAPKEMKTNKWQSRSENGGMNMLIPPGFGAAGIGSGKEQNGAHYYENGQHRLLIVGFGPGLESLLRDPTVTEKSECETEIAGRHVLITVYNWVVEDAVLSASGNAGAHFAAVARFYPSGNQREVFIAFISNVMYELKSFKQIFWTAAFDGAPAAVAAAPAAVTTVAAQPASTVVVGPVCSTALPPANLPVASAVIDSAIVGTLLASAAPIPSGFEVMRLQFDAGGELAGMNVSQSDLPEASQKELAAVVGTNLKAHGSKEPPSIYLRIDSSATGLRYSVVAPPSC
jgi:hypothetical protein